MGKSKKNKNIVKEIELPENVSASLNGQFLLIKGPKGVVERGLKQRNVSVKLNHQKIVLETKRGTREDRKLIGSLIAHIKNMVKGSVQGHTYILKICSKHFPMNANVSDNKLIIKNFLGEKAPRVLELKQGANVKVESDLIYVTSQNKEIAGQVSADIEQLTRRPGYDSRVFEDGIYIVSKDGKELK